MTHRPGTAWGGGTYRPARRAPKSTLALRPAKSPLAERRKRELEQIIKRIEEKSDVCGPNRPVLPQDGGAVLQTPNAVEPGGQDTAESCGEANTPDATGNGGDCSREETQ